MDPLQMVQGIAMYIVVLPEDLMSVVPVGYSDPLEKLYANALEEAIVTGIVTKAGKYGIHISFFKDTWTIHEIIED